MTRPGVVIDTREYEQRWDRRPEGRNEVWCVMGEAARGWALWFKGPYSHVARHLEPGVWHLIAVPQFTPDRDPGGFARNI